LTYGEFTKNKTSKDIPMKKKAIVVVVGLVGSSLIIYGSIVQSLAGLVGLALVAAAIFAAGCFRSTPRSERDERGAKAAVIASVIGQ
jgi:hypothetical protein